MEGVFRLDDTLFNISCYTYRIPMQIEVPPQELSRRSYHEIFYYTLNGPGH